MKLGFATVVQLHQIYAKHWMNSNGDLLSDKCIYFKKFYE